MATRDPENASDVARPASRTCALRNETFEACDAAELKPLLAFLARRVPVERRLDFPRGALLPDGRLDLCKQRIGPAGATALAAAVRGHPHVRHLLLGADGLGDTGAAAIAGLVRGSTLETVYLGCNLITAAGAQELADALTGQPTVTGLWLKRNPIGDAGGGTLAAMLRSNPTLRTLDLTQTGLTAVGLAELVEALTADGPGVERLYLGGNRLEPADAGLLTALLRGSPALRHLYLSVNRLGDAGTCAVAAGLRDNRSLRTLSLASNGLGPTGAVALAEALGRHPVLEALELGRQPSESVLGERPNAIGDEGAAAVAEALPGHPTLAVLDLSDNDISDAGAAVLADGLAGNRSLMELRLGKGVSAPRRRHLEELLGRNRAALGTPRAGAAPDLGVIRSVYRTAAFELRDNPVAASLELAVRRQVPNLPPQGS